MNLKNKLIIVSIALVCVFLFVIREEFSEGIWFSKVKPVIKKRENVKFFIASDIHYLSSTINDKGEAFQEYLENSDSKQINYVTEITDAFVEEIKKDKPEFLILSGDLTSNGEKESHIGIIEKLKMIENLGTAVYVIPGNHDILNPWASGFSGKEKYKVESISKEKFRTMYHEYGYNDAISFDRDTLSYLVPATKDTWLLMIDTSLYQENIESNSPEEEGQITLETFEWIKAASKLAEKNNAKIITVMHHNIIDHCSAFNKGFTLNYSDKALKKFRDYKLNIVLSGHIHIQDIAADQTDPKNKIYDIATGTLSSYPQKYGIFTFDKDTNLFNYSSKNLKLDNWVKINNIKDGNLINFSIYSKEYFDRKSYNMAERLIDGLDVTEGEKDLMSKTLKILNERVFEGNDGTVDDIKLSEGYKLWVEKSNDSIRNYIDTITFDTNLLDNELEIYVGQ